MPCYHRPILQCVTNLTITLRLIDDETPEVYKISDEEKVSVLAFKC